MDETGEGGAQIQAFARDGRVASMPSHHDPWNTRRFMRLTVTEDALPILVGLSSAVTSLTSAAGIVLSGGKMQDSEGDLVCCRIGQRSSCPGYVLDPAVTTCAGLRHGPSLSG